MRKALAAVIPALLLAALALQAALPVPRKAGEFLIKPPGGKEVAVSSLKGKVVVVQFLFTWCEHCQNTAKMLAKVKADYAAKGVEFYGVAFNDEAIKKPSEATTFSTKFANFPVGLSDRPTVMKYLGLSAMEQWGVPQIIVIDKQGVIQAQTQQKVAVEPLQHEPSLRNLLTMLVNKK